MKLQKITSFDQVNWTSAGIGLLFVLLCIVSAGKTLSSLGKIMAKTSLSSEKSLSTGQTGSDEVTIATPSANPELVPTETFIPTHTETPTQTPSPTVTPTPTIMESPTPTILENKENTQKNKKLRTLPFWKLPFDR